METQEKSTRNMYLVIGISVFVALVIVGGVLYALIGIGSTNEQTADGNVSGQGSVASSNEVRDDIDLLDENIEQLKTDKQTAEKAINDNKNQVKIGG